MLTLGAVSVNLSINETKNKNQNFLLFLLSILAVSVSKTTRKLNISLTILPVVLLQSFFVHHPRYSIEVMLRETGPNCYT